MSKELVKLNFGKGILSSGDKSYKKLTIEEVSPEEATLPAGLYDYNNNLIASWNTLVSTYGLRCYTDYTKSNYATKTTSPYYVFTKNSALSSGTKLVIGSTSSIGNYAFYKCTRLRSIVISKSVTSIGDYAFYDNTSLTDITLPDTVTYFGKYSFAGDTEVKNLYYIGNIGKYCTATFVNSGGHPMTPIGCENFYVNGVLTKHLAVPKGVTQISAEAFEDSPITSIEIPNSVTSIGVDAFRDAPIKTVYYMGDAEGWCNISFGNSVSLYNSNGLNLCFNGKLVTDITIPETITNLGAYAFQYCKSLINVNIPNSVTSIGNYTFRGCTSLESVNLSNSLTGLGSYTFNGCSSLKSITIPDSVTSIGSDTFRNCTSLVNVSIPDTIQSIGQYAFDGCTSINYNEHENGQYFGNENSPFVVLAKVKDTSVTSFEMNENTKFISNNVFSGCSNLASVTIGNSVRAIGASAFEDCSLLTNIEIPDSVTQIGDSAFENCSSLANVEFGNSLTNINYRAFAGCTSLTKIVIPENVTSMDDQVFSNCTKLRSVEILGKAPINRFAFGACSSLTELILHPNYYKMIDGYAFRGCTSLSSIKFMGTVEEWGDPLWTNDIYSECPLSKVICTDGTVTIDR